jgi:hypothetical protein
MTRAHCSSGIPGSRPHRHPNALLLTLLAGACGLSAPPSGHTVSGAVSGEAVAGVTITLSGGAKPYSGTTTATSTFSIGSVDDGTYLAVASLAG